MDHELPLVHKVKEISLEELKIYFQPKVFIEFCKACKYYNKIWTCPPYDFDIIKEFENYQYAYIIGSKLYNEDLKVGFSDLLNGESLDDISNKVYKAARIVIDKRLMSMDAGQESLHILLAGRCLICNSCTRERKLPCIYPEKMKFSLESVGFDVASICENILGDKLQWAKESMPEYLMLVSAVFSQERLNIEDIYNTVDSKGA